jgi:glutamate-1-semialdehyde 2,1-aminomutase
LGKVIRRAAGETYAGKRIMQMVAPLGAMYQAGTLSGNPLAMTAGIATLRLLQQPGTWAALEAAGATLERGIKQAEIPVQLARAGTMFTLFFSGAPPHDWPSARQANTQLLGVSSAHA